MRTARAARLCILIQPIRLIIYWLVDAVAVVGMCFFVVLEAKVAPSIPPCIDCTRMLTEVYILLWLLKYDDHHRLSIDGLGFFFFSWDGGS